jgi:hypothetical protein
MNNSLIIISFIACLLLFSCKKDDVEVMPDYTQTGERTFGAYVNGELWLPKGRPSTFIHNLNMTYDPGYHNGSLEITAYRILGDNHEENMHIYMSQLSSEGIYSLDDPKVGAAIFRGDCTYGREEGVYREGSLEITRLDMEEGIVAGKFEFTLAKPGCDTIRVTEGRFDYKL